MSSLLNREDVITAIERHAEAVVGKIPGVTPWNNCKYASPSGVCEIFFDEETSFCVEGPCSYYKGKE